MREAVELAYEGLDWLGVSPQSIGVCGLNPHAGDGGALARRRRFLIRCCERLQKKDSGFDGSSCGYLFHQALRGEYQAVVISIMIKDWHP